MPIGNPFPSKDFKIQVAVPVVAPAVPAWEDVGNMRSWSVDGNEDLSETDVFHRDDPIENVGRERMTFGLQGLLSEAVDDGQAIIQAAVAARSKLLIQVLWDGVNGWNAEARVSQRRGNGSAGNGFAEVNWDFRLAPSTLTAVEDGPTI